MSITDVGGCYPSTLPQKCLTYNHLASKKCHTNVNWGALWQVLPLPFYSCRLIVGPVQREALHFSWVWNSLQMKGAYVEEKTPRGKAFVYSSVPLLFPTGNRACLVFPLSSASSSKGSTFTEQRESRSCRSHSHPFSLQLPARVLLATSAFSLGILGLLSPLLCKHLLGKVAKAVFFSISSSLTLSLLFTKHFLKHDGKQTVNSFLSSEW